MSLQIKSFNKKRYVVAVASVLAMRLFCAPLAQGSDMPTSESVQRAIERGLDFLVEAQLPSGAFLAESCIITEKGDSCEPEITVWLSVLAAFSLVTLEDEKVFNILERLTVFLRGAMEPNNVWRYWSSEHSLYHTIGPDLDDTALCALVLRLQGLSFPEPPESLLRFRDETGRFYTWMDPDQLKHGQRELIERLKIARGYPILTPHDNDFDCQVNADVLAYFAYEGRSLPEVCAYLNETVERNQVPNCWLYGDSACLVYYFYMRAYELGAACLQPSCARIQQWLLKTQEPNGSWGDDAEQGSALSSLIITGYRGQALDRGVTNLLARQRPNGSWELTRLLDLVTIQMFHGSEAVTTALAIEALARYRALLDK